MTRSDILALREIAISTMDDARMLRQLAEKFPSEGLAYEHLHNIGSELFERSMILEAALNQQIHDKLVRSV